MYFFKPRMSFALASRDSVAASKDISADKGLRTSSWVCNLLSEYGVMVIISTGNDKRLAGFHVTKRGTFPYPFLGVGATS